MTWLNGAVSNTRLHAADHPQVVRYLQRAHGKLWQVLASQADITFLIVNDDIVVDNQPVISKTPHLAQFVQMLKQCAIERLTFSSEVTFEETVRSFLQGMLRNMDPLMMLASLKSSDE